MAEDSQFKLLGLTAQELTTLIRELGEAPFRARQLFHSIYSQRAVQIDSISTLSKSLRSSLITKGYHLGFPEVSGRFVSQDGTVRYLISFSDGQTVESVWMPGGDGSEEGDEIQMQGGTDSNAARRGTICLSSQSGCAVNCKFCMTALLGLQRNLTPGEIVGQVLLILNDHGIEIGRDRVNLVFMGQGEPFLNYESFISAARLLVEGVGIPESRMTVSTSGIVPRIADFGRETVRPRLAISLNASNDELRREIMPITRKWTLAALMQAAREFPLRARERLTFEYVLLAGVNDSVENARELVALLRDLRAKVNLIALNPGPEIAFKRPSAFAVERFQQILIAAGIPAYVRRPRGLDIYAACGQLKRTVELIQPH